MTRNNTFHSCLVRFHILGWYPATKQSLVKIQFNLNIISKFDGLPFTIYCLQNIKLSYLLRVFTCVLLTVNMHNQNFELKIGIKSDIDDRKGKQLFLVWLNLFLNCFCFTLWIKCRVGILCHKTPLFSFFQNPFHRYSPKALWTFLSVVPLFHIWRCTSNKVGKIMWKIEK